MGVSDSYPSRVARNGGVRRALGAGHTLGHIGSMMSSALLGQDFVAVHMTWGAVSELSTLTAYQRLVARTEHPVLTDLLRRIIKDERRHYAFYRAQAHMRLSRSLRARRITRWAMKHLWAPVGTGVRPQWETDFVITHLFGDADGMAAIGDMDVTVSSLPGLADAGLFRIAREEALVRIAPRPRPHSRRATPVAPEWACHASRAPAAAG